MTSYDWVRVGVDTVCVEKTNRSTKVSYKLCVTREKVLQLSIHNANIISVQFFNSTGTTIS